MNDYYPILPNDPNGQHEQNESIPAVVDTAVTVQKPHISYGRQIVSVSLGVMGIFLITLVAQIVILVAVQLFAPSLMDRDWFLMVYSSLSMYCIAMPLAYLIFRIGKAEVPKPCGRISFWAQLGLLAMVFGFSLVGSILGTLVQSVISLLMGQPAVNEVVELTSNTPLWANLVFAGILGPIMEELLYRKLVIDRLLVFGKLPAILISGILFGLIHGNFSQFFYCAAFGVLLGYVYVYTAKIRYTIALHMAMNLIAGVFVTEVLRVLEISDANADVVTQFSAHPVAGFLYLGYVLFMFACLAVTPLVIVLLRRYLRPERRPDDPKFTTTLKLFAKNPAFWALAIFLVAIFFV